MLLCGDICGRHQAMYRVLSPLAVYKGCLPPEMGTHRRSYQTHHKLFLPAAPCEYAVCRFPALHLTLASLSGASKRGDPFYQKKSSTPCNSSACTLPPGKAYRSRRYPRPSPWSRCAIALAHPCNCGPNGRCSTHRAGRPALVF